MHKEIKEMVNDAKNFMAHCDDSITSKECVIFDNCVVCSLYEAGYRKKSNEIARLNKEIEKLKEDREQCINALSDNYTFKTTRNGVIRVFDIIRKEAVKEFAEKIKHEMYMKSIIRLKGDNSPDLHTEDMEKIINNLLKEYGGVENE